MNPRALRGPVFVSLAAALFFLIFPNYIIRPDRPQDPGALQAALLILRYQPMAELLCAVVALIALAFYLRGRVGRAFLPAFSSVTTAAAVAVLVCAALSRIDIYELLFHPLGKPAFQAARETKLDGDEHLLAVNLKGARAYPIRTLTYHHIVNDVVDLSLIHI